MMRNISLHVLSTLTRALRLASIVAAVAGPVFAGPADGTIYPFGNAASDGTVAGSALPAPIVAMESTADGSGYWLAGSDGAIYPFGDASLYGGTAGQKLNAPIAGIEAVPGGKGYWLVGSGGTVYPFGDAQSLGGVTDGTS